MHVLGEASSWYSDHLTWCKRPSSLPTLSKSECKAPTFQIWRLNPKNSSLGLGAAPTYIISWIIYFCSSILADKQACTAHTNLIPRGSISSHGHAHIWRNNTARKHLKIRQWFLCSVLYSAPQPEDTVAVPKSVVLGDRVWMSHAAWNIESL